MLTAPQFAWACADAGDYPPPEPRKGARYGDDVVCALCGGETQGVGWPRKLGLPDTFTDIPYMVAPASQTLCQACVATARSEGWAQYIAAHPERGLKAAFDADCGRQGTSTPESLLTESAETLEQEGRTQGAPTPTAEKRQVTRKRVKHDNRLDLLLHSKA